MIRRLAVLALLLAASAAMADDATSILIARAMPYNPYARLSEIGHGVGIVFTPDLSVPGNCRFYESLGFACFEDADWSRVLDDIRLHNIFHPENRVRTDRKSTRLNSSHANISYAVFCLKKKKHY